MTPIRFRDRFDHVSVDSCANNGLHHGKMFQVVMGLEESITGEEFHQNAPDAPDVAWITPPEIENDLWSPIVSRGYDR